ncbi:MAG: hypothetical protein OZ921_12960, partial [Sorangiineae bacterium]|nr:hypothetical protein [Sorangiineae bacterium]
RAGPPRAASRGSDPRASAAPSARASPCPPGTLPDDGVCIPVPARGAADAGSPALAERWRVYDQLPRRPERPADYGRYALPVTTAGRAPATESGDGVELAAELGAEVRVARLERPVGDAEVRYAGPLAGRPGLAVLARQTTDEGGRRRDYLVVYGGLGRVAAGVAAGARLAEGATLGAVGPAGERAAPALRLETWRVQPGVDPGSLGPAALGRSADCVRADPRNVLALRP